MMIIMIIVIVISLNVSESHLWYGRVSTYLLWLPVATFCLRYVLTAKKQFSIDCVLRGTW
jgi:hypothetical protein